jgi:hypothetical protein
VRNDDLPQCWWIAGGERCGLDPGHDGEHGPYAPGEYLPLPRLHPLDVLRVALHRACPLCGVRLTGWSYSVAERVMRLADDGRWAEMPPECTWWFEPCWHRASEVLPWDAIGWRRGSA